MGAFANMARADGRLAMTITSPLFGHQNAARSAGEGHFLPTRARAEAKPIFEYGEGPHLRTKLSFRNKPPILGGLKDPNCFQSQSWRNSFTLLI
jgi:hypothetical protein